MLWPSTLILHTLSVSRELWWFASGSPFAKILGSSNNPAAESEKISFIFLTKKHEHYSSKSLTEITKQSDTELLILNHMMWHTQTKSTALSAAIQEEHFSCLPNFSISFLFPEFVAYITETQNVRMLCRGNNSEVRPVPIAKFRGLILLPPCTFHCNTAL